MIKVNPFIFLFSVIGGIIVFIMAETWGAMPKNQVDDQLISEAIAEAIAIHEADPTSHMGEGESIDMHRTNEIIDHPAGSIVPDKSSPIQPIFQTFFENTDTWEKSGGWLSSFCDLSIMVRGNTSGDSYIYNENFEFLTNTVDNSPVDNLMQTQFTYSQNYYTANYYFGMGTLDYFEPTPVSAGFKIENGILYTSFGNEVTLTFTQYGALNAGQRYIVRIQVSKEFKEVYWLVNGTVIRTESLDNVEAFYIIGWGAYAKKVGGTTVNQLSMLRFKYVLVGNEIL